MRDAAQVAGCANNQHQLLIALHTWDADNDGVFPPESGYRDVPHRAIHGSGDFFDVLVPEYLEPPEVWYCPDGPLAPDTGVWTGTPHVTSNSVWDFQDSGQGHVFITENIYCNLPERAGYTDIPRKLSDPGDWVVVNDWTVFWSATDAYVISNHPGRLMFWGVGHAIRGRNGFGRPRGVNTGIVDGSVGWAPINECMLGYPSCGGAVGGQYDTCRTLQPSRPGRPGYLP